MEAKWLNDPRFNSIDERKKKYLERVFTQIEGKPMNEVVKIFSQTSAEMKKEGLSLTQSEANLMIEYLMNNMTPTEKQKWNKINEYMKNKR